VFVQIELDWRELSIFILVGEMVDGRRPSGYYVDRAGRHVRWHLGAALEEGDYAEQARILTAVTKKSGRQAMLEQIEANSVSLRTPLPALPRLIRRLQTR
jgi:hypothetical protein